MSTVLYLFDLKADIDPAAYEAWAASVDLPTLNSLPSVRGYRILRTRVTDSSPANPAQPASYVELLDVTSDAQFHADMAGPALVDVAATFTRFARTPTVLVGDELPATESTQRIANAPSTSRPGQRSGPIGTQSTRSRNGEPPIMRTGLSTSPSTSQVTATPPMAADGSHDYFLAKLACEADPADIARAIAAGTADFTLVDCRPSGNYSKTHLPQRRQPAVGRHHRSDHRRPAGRLPRHLLLGTLLQRRHQRRRTADRARQAGQRNDRRARILDPRRASDRRTPTHRARGGEAVGLGPDHVNADAPPSVAAGMGRGRPVYLVTSADQPTLGEDDRLLHQALIAADVPTMIVTWTDPDVDWAGAGVCVIRSVWDYHLYPDRFRSWLTTVAAISTVVNPARIVRWNMHKRYLRQLAAHGVPTIETIWITPGSQVMLSEVLADRGWKQALIKPAVSASAWKTAKVQADDPAGQNLVREILQHTDVMVQPYLDSIEHDGEVSLVAVEGNLTHAARRGSALTGDIETTRLGSAHASTAEERKLATRALCLLATVPLYARIDLVRDQQQRLLLGELELIEPVLYLRHGQRAVDQLVTALARCRQPSRQPKVADHCAATRSDPVRAPRCGPHARRDA